MIKPNIILGVLGLLITANLFIWQAVAYEGDVAAKIYFLNVGQGDATLVITPHHQKILIDGGPDRQVLTELGKVLPLWDKTIDVVVSTHPQADHLNGLVAVTNNFHIKKAILSAGYPTDSPEIYHQWINKLENQKTEIVYATPSSDLSLDDVDFDILLPETTDTCTTEANDCSVVSEVLYANRRILLMSDAGFITENKLLNLYPGLSADILRIGHHGSKTSTSSELLMQVHPTTAIISVGKNTYGHPTPETLNRLTIAGIKILRTDINGTIKINL